MTEAIQNWAGSRKLAYEASGELPYTVPLLGLGNRRVCTDIVKGEFGEGLDGILANFDYITKSKDSTHHHPFAVALVAIPESIAFAPRLFCIGDGMPSATKGAAEDNFQPPDERVELESVAMQDRYKVWASSEIGRNWLTQLFSPAFMAWMIEQTPKTFSFQLTDGALCGYVEGETSDPAVFESLRVATAEVARRIRAECHEEKGMDTAGRAAVAFSPFSAKVEEKISRISWSTAPADAATAVKAYRRVARRMLRPYLDGLVAGIVATGIGALWVDTGSFKASVGLGSILGIIAAVAATRAGIGVRARRFGHESFVREYAKSRGLQTESARRFQARHMALAIPGGAEQAMTGTLPGDLEGTLLFSRDKSNRRKPVDHQVVVANGQVALSEEAARDLRTAEGLDAFCRRAAAKARSGTSPDTSESSRRPVGPAERS